MTKEEEKIGFADMRNKCLSISESSLEQLFLTVIGYYNTIQKISPVLLQKDAVQKWHYSSEDDIIKQIYNTYHDDILNDLTKLLEDVYTETSGKIREMYGENLNYPTSHIEFFNRDNIDINERLAKWYNPYTENNTLNFDFIIDKEVAKNKIKAIAYTETIHEMEIVKYEKLFPFLEADGELEILNADDEDDCFHNTACQLRWGTYHVTDSDFPPELPPYHPECECYTSYHINIGDKIKLEGHTDPIGEGEIIN